MAVNSAVEGRTYSCPPVTVGATQISAFADAVRASSPLHRDSAAAKQAGFADVVATPTFAVTIAQQAEALFMTDPEANVDYSRLVHGEESFTHHAPIVAGDELVATTTVARVRSAGGHDMVTLNTEVETTSGQKRASTVSTVVIRGEA